jgi:2-amino-4-hydroxy-6-hydroxymethyldihydropteridine diphosphokinase
MSVVYFSLGSNLGDRVALLEEAIGFIEESMGNVVSRSTMKETEPWGYASTHRFINACIAVNTARSPLECLLILQSIEKRMGRLKSGKKGYSDRTIDIDIILFDDLVMETSNLVLPHPHLHERLFVLEPMMEIAPDLVHPRLGLTIRSLYEALILAP